MSGSVNEECAQDRLAVDVPQRFGTGPLRMGHHPKHIAVLVADSGNIPERSIGVGGRNDISALVGIAIDHPVTPLQFVKGPVIGVITAFTMGNGNLEYIPFVACATQ